MSVKEIEAAIHELGVEQKLGLMEAIWADLTRDEDKVPIPPWHLEVLEERQRRWDRGECVLLDLDDAIAEVRRRIAK